MIWHPQRGSVQTLKDLRHVTRCYLKGVIVESQKCSSHRLPPLPLKKKRTLSRGSVKKPTIIQKKLETELLYFISFLVQIIAIYVSGGLFLPIVFFRYSSSIWIPGAGLSRSCVSKHKLIDSVKACIFT